MACRGVLFALTDEQEKQVLAAAAQGDEQLGEVIEEIEEDWDEENIQELDKSWDAIHRCLSDGTSDFAGGTYPLNRAILGGLQLYEGDDYIVSFIAKNEVVDLTVALNAVVNTWFRDRYFRLDETDYPKNYIDETDFEYSWEYFEMLRDFYQNAARSGRSVIFTVDQ